MGRFRIRLALALALASGPAGAAGFRQIEVPADAAGPAIHGAIWSPCAAPARRIELGAIAVAGVPDCPIVGDRLPLVVISHGRGGSFVGHLDIAETLADAGFVVAALDHPGDTAADLSRTDDVAVFIERPLDIKRLIDFMLAGSPAAGRLDAARIGFFGFSRGGYTGLVLIGADVDWPLIVERCASIQARACTQISAGQYPAAPLTHDPRIKAAVIADPLALLFGPASFARIGVPVQLWASARGGDGVEPAHVAGVEHALPGPHEYHVVPDSAHFAFLAPCPAALVARRPELCTDAPGFDRVAFHRQLDAAVLAFLRSHL